MRRCVNVTSCKANTYYVRRWGQFIQIWAYSFLFSLNYLSDVAVIVTFALAEDWKNMIILSTIVLFASFMVTTVDVIGDASKSSGHNRPSLVTLIFYLTTIYLPRVVWKSAGHPETMKDEWLEKDGNRLSQEMATLYNHITPKTGDIKDIIGLQAILQSAPALLLYVSALMLNTDLHSYVLYVSMALSFLVLVLAPLLGDWETAKKDFKQTGWKMIIVIFLQFLKRTIEICGRMGYYIYFQAVTGWGIYLALSLDFFLMRITYFQSKPSSSKSRFSNEFHKFYCSMAAMFFGFYRRPTVDKLVDANSTMMPPAVELVRYIFKFITTALGYFIILGISTKEGWFYVEEDRDLVTYVFFLGVVCNGLLFLIVMLIEFCCARRKTVRKADFKALIEFWKSKVCFPNEYHIGQDLEHDSTPGGNLTGMGGSKDDTYIA